MWAASGSRRKEGKTERVSRELRCVGERYTGRQSRMNHTKRDGERMQRLNDARRQSQVDKQDWAWRRGNTADRFPLTHLVKRSTCADWAWYWYLLVQSQLFSRHTSLFMQDATRTPSARRSEAEAMYRVASRWAGSASGVRMDRAADWVWAGACNAISAERATARLCGTRLGVLHQSLAASKSRLVSRTMQGRG